MYSDSNGEKHEEEKGSVLSSCDHCSSASHDPADTALTQEVSNQVHLLLAAHDLKLCLQSTADYKVFWDGALFIPPGGAVISPAVIKSIY